MATAANGLYIPTVQREYLIPSMMDDKAYAALLTSDILDIEVAEITKEGGDTANIPTIFRAAEFTHQLTGSANPVATNVVNVAPDKAVVLSDYNVNQFYHSQLRQVNEALGVKLSKSLGMRLAKRFAQQILAGASAQIGAMSYTNYLANLGTSTGIHDWVQTSAHSGNTAGGTNVLWSGTNAVYKPSIADVLNAKMLMQDYFQELTTMFVHPLVLQDLLIDFLTNYKVQGTTWEQIVTQGGLNSLLGFKDIVCTILTPTSTGSDSSAVKTQYVTLFLGDDSIAHSFQSEPETEDAGTGGVGMTNQDTIHYMKTTCRYITHLKGVAVASGMGANPVDADFANTSKWTPVYQDHRDVKAVRYVTCAGATT